MTLRQEIVAASGLVALTGVWLVLSPLILGYESEDAAWNPVLVGTAVLLLAAVRLAVARWDSWISWLNALLGAWLLVASFWLAESAAASWNEAASGAAIIVFAALSGGASAAARRTAVGQQGT